jgi:hypothetical protein
MEGDRRDGRRLRSFMYGAVVGASAAVAAARRRRSPQLRESPAGLAAFEGAPCFRETLEREAGQDERRT